MRMNGSARRTHGFLNATVSELYRSPGPAWEVVVGLWICNTDSANRNVSVYHTPADEAPTSESLILDGSIVRAKTTEIVTAPIILAAGEAIHAYATAASVVTLIAYVIPYDHWIRAR